jgi:putative Holliday junction resolvase
MTKREPVKILGIDFGQKRVGLAVGDSLLRVATGFNYFQYKEMRGFLDRLRTIVRDEGIGLVVIGLPKNMDGSEGAAARKVRQAAKIIKTNLAVDIDFVDERLTTMQATRRLHEGEGKVGKSRGKIDIMSAILILQTYLDRLPPDD